jgi:[acyl-carrier-protein] S-malonyltransferase
MTKTAFIFPGQGSQFVGMGKDLFDAYPWAREIFALADKVTDKPISKLCFEGPLEELTLTGFLQPAVTAVNLVCFQALIDRDVRPDAAAGHSLGEYSALAAAGVLTVGDTLKLVNLRGELMQRDADRHPGTMQAIMGLSAADVEAVAELARDRGVVVAANYNTPQQIVISGDGQGVAVAVKFAQAKGGKTLPLPVAGAWHSPLMESAAADFARTLGKVEFMAPSCPVYLNVTGRVETDPVKIKEVMVRQITSPVWWTDLVENMLADGVTNFVEVGPKKVLAGLVRKILPKDAPVNVVNVQDLSSADKAAADLKA